MRDYLNTVSKATSKAFDRVGKAAEPTRQDNEVANYMKLTPSDFASLVSEFGMAAVEPYIRQMEMRRMRERGNHGT
jgi:hypothetical protein